MIMMKLDDLDPVDMIYWNSIRASGFAQFAAGAFSQMVPANENRIALIIFAPQTSAVQFMIDQAGSAGAVGQLGTGAAPIILSRRVHGDVVRARWDAAGIGGAANLNWVEVLVRGQCPCWDNVK
jgi:hypothetical protein